MEGPLRLTRVLILALAVLMGLATACTREADDGGVHLTWATLKDETGIEGRLIEQFERENPGVHVTLQPMPPSSDTMHNQYATYLISEDESFDLYSIDVVWPAEFASAGWARPLDDLFPAEERAKFLPGPVEACTYQGHVYAVPWYTDAGMLYYRKDILEEKGVKPPATWSELVAAAKQLQDADRFGFVFQAAQYEGLVCNLLEYFWGNGGTVLDADGRVVLDSPENVAALQLVVDMIIKDRITPPGIKTYKEDESLQAFRAGKAVFMRNWPYVWGLTQRPREQLLGKVGMVPVPHADSCPKSGACLGGWNIMLSKYTRHPTQAWKFAQFITSQEAQKARFLDSARLPTRVAVYEDVEVRRDNPQIATFLEIFKLARPRPVTPYYSKVSDIMQIQIHRAISGDTDAATALKTAADQMRRIPGFQGGP